MKLFLPITKLDDEQRMVWGYATTPAVDSQGEIITREAVEAALPAYMRFANIREMHQLSAVGIAKEADLDEKGLYLGAKVVDDEAWAKVKEGVYKGFSIGGRVTSRDAADRKIITGLDLSEISLVDRPANPEAVIDVAKVIGVAAAKIGARNSQADLDRIQRVHDTSVELGAACAGDHAAPEDDGEGDDDADDDTLGAAARGRLAKLARLGARIEQLSRIVERQGALLQRLAAEPAMPAYRRAAQALEKSRDGAAAEEPPKTALDAIRKAQRQPLKFGIA